MEMRAIFWRHSLQNAKLNLTEWNDYLFGLYIPLDILFGMFLIIGIFGNGTVLYVHAFKMIKRKDGEYFIPYLATVDLAGCIICSLFALSRTLQPVTYEYELLCKVGNFLSGITIYLSMFLLFAIAFQRYAKICRGTGFIERKKRWSLLFFISFLSVLLAVPALASVGCVPFYSKFRDVTGQVCGTLSGTGPFIYDTIIIIAIPMCCVVFVVLYLVIGVKISKSLYLGRHRGGAKCHNDKTSVSTITESKSTTQVIKRNIQIRNKITVVFIFVTLSFIFCTLPKAILMMFETFSENFWHGFNDKDRMLLLFVSEGYILFFVVNPFIYAFLDSNFRKHLKGVKKPVSKRTSAKNYIPEPVWDD